MKFWICSWRNIPIYIVIKPDKRERRKKTQFILKNGLFQNLQNQLEDCAHPVPLHKTKIEKPMSNCVICSNCLFRNACSHYLYEVFVDFSVSISYYCTKSQAMQLCLLYFFFANDGAHFFSRRGLLVWLFSTFTCLLVSATVECFVSCVFKVKPIIFTWNDLWMTVFNYCLFFTLVSK